MPVTLCDCVSACVSVSVCFVHLSNQIAERGKFRYHKHYILKVESLDKRTHTPTHAHSHTQTPHTHTHTHTHRETRTHTHPHVAHTWHTRSCTQPAYARHTHCLWHTQTHMHTYTHTHTQTHTHTHTTQQTPQTRAPTTLI